MSALEMAIDPAGVKDIQNLYEIELQRSFADRVLKPVLNKFGKLLTWSMPKARLQRIEKQLASTDGMWNLTPVSMAGLQVLLALAGLGVGFLIGQLLLGPPQNLEAGFAGALGGYVYPNMALGRRVKTRRKEILKGLPNALDLIVVSVEAGLSLDAAFEQVSENFKNPLADEMGIVLNQMRLGLPRREALGEMDKRCQIEEVTVLIGSILQSEQLGVSLGTTLRVQAEEVRRRRRQRAEQMGAKAPLKMLFPMVGCIFPTLFIVLLGPAAITLIHDFMGT
jgi:tight adherence protein C